MGRLAVIRSVRAPALRSHQRGRTLWWLPAVFALPVATLAGCYAFDQIVVNALNSSPVYRHPLWLGASFCLQVLVVLTTFGLVALGWPLRPRRHALAVIGWLTVAISVITPFACTWLAGQR